MKTVKISAAFLALAALALGCSEPNAPTDSARGIAETAFNFTNGPDSPGPVVVRYEGVPYFILTNDPVGDLMGVHVIVTDNALCGGSQGPFNLIDQQFVDTPSEVEQMTSLFKDSDNAVGVYGTADFNEFFADPCGFIEGPKKIAEGTSDFHRTESENANNNTRTSRWVGFLDGVDGNTYHFLDVQKFVEGPGWVVEDIKLTLVPGK